MALTDKLTAIGDAIRAKTGETALLKLDDMPTAIAGIQTGSSESDNILASLLDGSITEIRIPDNVTSLVAYALAERKNLTKVDLNNVTKVYGSAMYACTNLSEVDFSKIEYVYGSNILNATKVKILDLASIKNIGLKASGYDRFFQATSELVEIKNFKPKYLEGYIFFGCNKLEIIDLSELIEIGYASLSGCNKLGDIILPKIQKIGQGAFSTSSSNTNRTKIDIGADCVSIAAEAFKDSKNVKAVIVRAITPPTLANINAFNFIPTTAGDHDVYIYVPAESYSAYLSATNWTSFVGSGLTFRKIEDYPEITGG